MFGVPEKEHIRDDQDCEEVEHAAKDNDESGAPGWAGWRVGGMRLWAGLRKEDEEEEHSGVVVSGSNA